MSRRSATMIVWLAVVLCSEGGEHCCCWLLRRRVHATPITSASRYGSKTA